MTDEPPNAQRVLLVTGPSGAGRSTAINALEDLGYEVIDNLPLGLVPRLIDGPTLRRPMALGLDVRNRDFEPGAVLDMQAQLAATTGLLPEIVYLDAARDVLLRRYSETRRRHPLAPTTAPDDGIVAEASLLEPLRAAADILIETSDMTPHDLAREIQRLFGLDQGQILAVAVQSFSYKRGLPRGADMVLDCRFLNNPHWQPELRPFTGRDGTVARFVASDPRYETFVAQVIGLLDLQLPSCVEEGKAHFSIAFGCTGGRHRSVAVAEAVGQTLAAACWRVSMRHRELERQGLDVKAKPMGPPADRTVA